MGVIDKGDVQVSVPLTMTAEQLDKIVAWCRRSEAKEESNHLVKCIFEDNVKELTKFIEIAQFLDIEPLVDSLSEHVAILLEKMDVDEMRKALGREGRSPCSQEQLQTVQELQKLFS